MHILKKLIRVPQVLTIKKEYSQLILQRHAYGTNKDILYENEQINCNNIIKNTKNDQLWWCYRRKQNKAKLTLHYRISV